MAVAVAIGSWDWRWELITILHGREIKKIMNETYPNLNVQYYYADLDYMALDLEDLQSIWKNESILDQ